jgi:hypothetical protein
VGWHRRDAACAEARQRLATLITGPRLQETRYFRCLINGQDGALSAVEGWAPQRSDGQLEVAAVDVGAGSLLRRLGLRPLGDRIKPFIVDWTELHRTSHRGHTVQLATATTAYTGSTHPSCRISARLSADKAVDVGRAAHPAHAAAAPHCQPWPYWLFCPTPQTSRSAIRRSQGCPTRRPAIPFTLNCEEPRQVGTFAPVRILPSADGDSPSSPTSETKKGG